MTANPFDTIVEQIQALRVELAEAIGRIERKLADDVPLPKPKDTYSVAEAATLLGKQTYTVRQWCQHGRINARNGEVRRGKGTIWLISADEIDRYRRENLLPLNPGRNKSDHTSSRRQINTPTP